MKHRERLFHALYETPADAGTATDVAPEDPPFEPGEITFPDEGDVGRAVRERTGLTHRNDRGQFTRVDDDDTVEGSGPPPLEPPAAPAAPVAPAAPAAPADPNAPPGGDLGEPQPRGTINPDGSVTLANGHTYASAQAAVDALWHAQDAISRGLHRAPDAPAAEQIPAEEEAGVLLGAGAPIGGEPQTVAELIDWAQENPAAAGRWTLANQTRVNNPQLVRDIYKFWGEADGADRDAYNGELNAQRQAQVASELEARILEQLAPYLEAQTQAEITHYDAQLEALPYFEHYHPRIAAELQSDPDFLEQYRVMSPAEKFRVCKSIYSELRVDDSITAGTGQPATPAAPGGVVAAAQAAAAPAVASAAPPVVEGRGGAAPPPIDRNDTRALVKRAVASYQSRSDLFSPDAPAT